MKSRYASAVGLAVVLLAVVTACGGGDGSPGGEKQAYIDQIDPLCQDSIQEADSLGDGTDVATLEKVKNVWFELYTEVHALPVPDEGFDQGSTFVAGINNISLAAEDAYQSALVNNQANLQNALNRQDQALKNTSEVAGDYGFNECDHLDEAAQGSAGSSSDEEHEDDDH